MSKEKEVIGEHIPSLTCIFLRLKLRQKVVPTEHISARCMIIVEKASTFFAKFPYPIMKPLTASFVDIMSFTASPHSAEA